MHACTYLSHRHSSSSYLCIDFMNKIGIKIRSCFPILSSSLFQMCGFFQCISVSTMCISNVYFNCLKLVNPQKIAVIIDFAPLLTALHLRSKKTVFKNSFCCVSIIFANKLIHESYLQQEWTNESNMKMRVTGKSNLKKKKKKATNSDVSY